MELIWWKRKLYVATITTFLSTIITYLIFIDEIEKSILWIVFLVFSLAIFTYGIGVSILSDYIANKVKLKTVAFLTRFIVYIIFGSGFFLFEFISVYGLIAAISYFIIEEFLKMLSRFKVKNNFK